MSFKWYVPENNEIAKQWRKEIKKYLESEDEQFPQWCQSLGVELPEYANLKLPPSKQFGIYKTHTKTDYLLTLFDDTELVGFLFVLVQKHKNEQEVTLSDVYIKPDYRKTKASDVVIDKIIEIIKLENVEKTVFSTLLASTSGIRFYNKLKTRLNNENILADYNTSIDPTYNL